MEKVSVHRHWAGKRPQWAGDEEEGEDLEVMVAARRRGGTAASGVGDGSDPLQDDPRLRRMAESRAAGGADRGRRRVHEAEVVEGDDSDSGAEDKIAKRRARARARAEAEEPAAADVAAAAVAKGRGINTGGKDDDKDDDDDDDIEGRRARVRARAQQRQHQAELAVEDESDKEDDSESGSSEYETATDSSEEEQPLWGVRRLAKPVFVRASERESIIERDRQYEEEEKREEEKIAAKENRKVETRQKIASEIQKEQDGVEEAAEHDPMPDDDDEADEVALYEAWKIRELRRVMREHTERRKAEQAKADIERRRNLTDEEIKAEDAAAFKNTKEGMKEEKWGFMQKYLPCPFRSAIIIVVDRKVVDRACTLFMI